MKVRDSGKEKKIEKVQNKRKMKQNKKSTAKNQTNKNR